MVHTICCEQHQFVFVDVLESILGHLSGMRSCVVLLQKRSFSFNQYRVLLAQNTKHFFLSFRGVDIYSLNIWYEFVVNYPLIIPPDSRHDHVIGILIYLVTGSGSWFLVSNCLCVFACRTNISIENKLLKYWKNFCFNMIRPQNCHGIVTDITLWESEAAYLCYIIAQIWNLNGISVSLFRVSSLYESKINFPQRSFHIHQQN